MKKRHQNIIFETDNGSMYFLDEINSQFYLCHPLLSYIYLNVIEFNKNEKQFISNLQFPVTIQKKDYTKEDFLYYYKKFKFFVRNKIFTKKRDVNIFLGKIVSQDIINAISNTQQLVIEMTQRCNLNCIYCGYGEFYERDLGRNNKDINIENIKAIIKYLYLYYWESTNNISVKKRIMINFFGGEPLLKFKEIVEITEFIKKIDSKKVYFTFGITTNAILLNEKMLHYFSENKFILSISIDGNKYNNSYRIFQNKRESYDILKRKIDMIKESYPQYFNDYIFFISVLHNRNSVEDINDFLSKEYEKKSLIGEINTDCVKKDKKELFEQFKHVDTKKSEYQTQIQIETLLKRIIHTYNQYTVSSIYQLLTKAENKRIPTGTCIPLKKKIFITSNFLLLPCEKINFRFNYGQLPNNIDNALEEKISCVVNSHNKYLSKIKDKCAICYNNWMCNRCIFHLTHNTDGSIYCNHFLSKEELKDILSKSIFYLEKNPFVYNKIVNAFNTTKL
jgi:uncharacterized protein